MVDANEIRKGKIITFQGEVTELGISTVSVLSCGYYLHVPLNAVVKIEEPAFDWSTVKAGMAFNWNPPKHVRENPCLVRYIGRSIKTPQCDVYEIDLSEGGAALNWMPRKDELTRAPEHDIEVQNA